jgi:hypothetical protein
LRIAIAGRQGGGGKFVLYNDSNLVDSAVQPGAFVDNIFYRRSFVPQAFGEPRNPTRLIRNLCKELIQRDAWDAKTDRRNN